MKERIVEIVKGPFPKKYTANIQHNTTRKIRKLHFGDQRYQQYKDRTNLKLYAHKNHSERRRLRLYYSRHSGVTSRRYAIRLEKQKSKGLYNAKILSHTYLW